MKPLYPKHLELMLENIYADIIALLYPKIKRILLNKYASFKIKTDGAMNDPVSDLWDQIEVWVNSPAMTLKLQRLHKVLERWTSGQVQNALRNMKGVKDKDVRALAVEKSLDDPDILQSTDNFIKKEKEMIEDAGKDFIGGMQETAHTSFMEGEGTEELANKLQGFAEISDSKARFWASDMLGDAYSSYTETMHAKAGIKNYIWRTSGDNAVRENHRELNGRVFGWSKGAAFTGLLDKPGAKNPGDDFRCRCSGEPTFREAEQ